MKKLSIKKKQKGFLTLVLSAVMAFSQAGCGKSDSGTPDNNDASIGTNGYVYVAEYHDLGIDYASNLTLADDHIYYSAYNWDETTETGAYSIYKKAVSADGEAEPLPIQIPPEMSIMQFLLTKDDHYIVFYSEYIEDLTNPNGYRQNYYLHKYDEQGQVIYEQDITAVMTEEEYPYIQSAVLDMEGNIYARAENNVFLFREDGSYHGSVSVDNYIMNMGNSKDGKVYISYYGGESVALSEVDFASKSIGTAHGSFPAYSGIFPGIEKDILTYDERKVYEYDLSTDSYAETLDWLDSDLNGQYVDALTMLEDGRIAAFYRDWGSGNSMEMVLLTKTEASNVAEKEVILIGTLYTSQLLQDLAVKFNKTNNNYRIKIKEYIDNTNWSETSYQDAVTALNNEITSGNGPDIILLSEELPIRTYADKGLFDDLAGYLEKSSSLNQSDFVESVLNAYTYDGKLIGITDSFYVETILGKTSLVGEKQGWTLEEMMEYAASYPEADIFSYATKESILRDCLQYNQNAFIDYASGNCNFDTVDFKKVLEYANLFPTEYSYDEDAKSTPRKIQDNEQLLERVSLGDTLNFQMYLAMFEEPITCIGYPTVDGGTGNMIRTSGSGAYGISTKSNNKDGAWAFIEYVLTTSSTNGTFFYGFPSIKENLEAVFEKDMTEDYILDMNDEPELDENGEPQINPKTSWGWDDWETTLYAATQEQVDMLWDVINTAQPVTGNDRQVLDIILEEAQPYFEGQKSVDEVAQVIQSRVQIYISENM